MKSKILGICGGNGVILYPFKNNLIANIEVRSIFHTPKDIQWSLNFDCSQYKKFIQLKDQVDIIVGAPDCGHSSVLSYSRAKKLSDPLANKSLQVFIESIKFYKPKMFMMENLPKALDEEGFRKVFPNYRLKFFVSSVSKWGNSQKSRIRLVIVGIRKDIGFHRKNLKYPLQTSLKSAGELIKGLGINEIPELVHVRETEDFTIPLYYKGLRKITTKKAREIWNSYPPEKKRWDVEGMKFKNQPGIYRNPKDELPLTVRKQNRQFNHYGLMLSPREIARIQGIPDSFKLWYDPKLRNRCINKARATCAKTPPHEIGAWFYKIVIKLEKYEKSKASRRKQ